MRIHGAFESMAHLGFSKVEHLLHGLCDGHRSAVLQPLIQQRFNNRIAFLKPTFERLDDRRFGLDVRGLWYRSGLLTFHRDGFNLRLCLRLIASVDHGYRWGLVEKDEIIDPDNEDNKHQVSDLSEHAGPTRPTSRRVTDIDGVF